MGVTGKLLLGRIEAAVTSIITVSFHSVYKPAQLVADKFQARLTSQESKSEVLDGGETKNIGDTCQHLVFFMAM